MKLFMCEKNEISWEMFWKKLNRFVDKAKILEHTVFEPAIISITEDVVIH